MMVITKNIENEARNDYSNATEVADYLAKKGLPFREGLEVTGKIVRYTLDEKKLFLELTLSTYQQFLLLFSEDIFTAFTLEI